MAEIYIYDIVEKHLPQDYIGSEPVSIFETVKSVLSWMKNHSIEDFQLLTGKGKKCEMEYDGDIKKFQLDSTMFTDKGNELMKACYDKWVSVINFDKLFHSIDIPVHATDDDFSGFQAKLKQLQGDPHFVNAEPNLEDTYKDVKKNPVSESVDFFKILDENSEQPKSEMKIIEESKQINEVAHKDPKTFDDVLTNFLN